uniref:Peptidase M12B domain-containing protein n=1 Tax=Ditylenchus dipsaci TaxID=166011 RepID=A0A915E0F2_9BILA
MLRLCFFDCINADNMFLLLHNYPQLARFAKNNLLHLETHCQKSPMGCRRYTEALDFMCSLSKIPEKSDLEPQNFCANIMVTARNLYDPLNKRALGLAQAAYMYNDGVEDLTALGLCDSNLVDDPNCGHKVYSNMAFIFLTGDEEEDSSTMCHEFCHMCGAEHDEDQADQSCSKKQYLMSARPGKLLPEFSRCTKKMLRSITANILKRSPYNKPFCLIVKDFVKVGEVYKETQGGGNGAKKQTNAGNAKKPSKQQNQPEKPKQELQVS